MPEIVARTLSPSQAEHSRRWDRLRADIFDPLALPKALTHELARKDDLLRDSFADLRTESAARLNPENLALRWHDQTDSEPKTDAQPVPFEIIKGLRSILRKAISNVLRQSLPGRAPYRRRSRRRKSNPSIWPWSV